MCWIYTWIAVICFLLNSSQLKKTKTVFFVCAKKATIQLCYICEIMTETFRLSFRVKKAF